MGTSGIAGSFDLPKITFRVFPLRDAPSNAPSPTDKSATVEVQSGTSVLDAAFSGGVLIPTVCGGFAKCHACKIFVPAADADALTPIAPDERRMIQNQGNAEGTRLACQARVLADVLVEIHSSTLEPGT